MNAALPSHRRVAVLTTLLAASGVTYACSSSNPSVQAGRGPFDGGNAGDAAVSFVDASSPATGDDSGSVEADGGTATGDAATIMDAHTQPVVDTGFFDVNAFGPPNDDAYVPCGITNCSPGCCQSGVCVPGTAPTLCGASGNACTDCTMMPGDLTCTPSPSGYLCSAAEDSGANGASDDAGAD